MYQIIIENFGNDEHEYEKTCISKSEILHSCIYKFNGLYDAACALNLRPDMKARDCFHYSIGMNERLKVSIVEVS